MGLLPDWQRFSGFRLALRSSICVHFPGGNVFRGTGETLERNRTFTLVLKYEFNFVFITSEKITSLQPARRLCLDHRLRRITASILDPSPITRCIQQILRDLFAF